MLTNYQLTILKNHSSNAIAYLQWVWKRLLQAEFLQSELNHYKTDHAGSQFKVVEWNAIIP